MKKRPPARVGREQKVYNLFVRFRLLRIYQLAIP